jgi:O-antigen ligase
MGSRRIVSPSWHACCSFNARRLATSSEKQIKGGGMTHETFRNAPMSAQAQAMRAVRERGDQRDALETLFLLSALLAPVNLRVFRAFTMYDLVTALIALLIIAGSHRIRLIPSSLRVAAFLLLIAGLVSAFRSTYPMEALWQILQYAFIFFVQLPVILTLCRSRATVNRALAMVILGYLVVIVVAMFEQEQVAGRVLPFYNTENPNALAFPAAFLLPFVMYFALDQWRKGRRLSVLIGGGAVLYLMLWALTASASRASAGATIVSLVLFVAFSRELAFTKILARVGLLALAVGTVGVVVYWTNVFPGTLGSRIERTFSPQEEHALTDERLALDRAGVQAFLESPLVGTGLDNFRYVAQFYDDDAPFHDPHNLWIQFLAQTGVVGAAVFLFIIVRWLVLLLRTQSISTTRSRRELLWAFIAAMAGILVHSMVAPLVLHRHYWLIYGLGIVVAAAHSPEIEGASGGVGFILPTETKPT